MSRSINIGIGILAAGVTIGGLATIGNNRATDNAYAAQGAAPVDPRLALPASLDRSLKTEIEAAVTGADLEAVLQRHPDQGQLIVPRIEALTLDEIRRTGPGDRYVIPGLEPDEGEGNSVTLESSDGRMALLKEFPGDAAQARFSDGSIHRFVGQFPFADVLTLHGEGDKNHRLTFAIFDNVGMVYVRGAGRVVVSIADGKQTTIELGKAQ